MIVLVLIFPVFLFTLFNFREINQIFEGIGQLEEGWNVYPPISAINSNSKLLNDSHLNPAFMIFEFILLFLNGYLFLSIYRKLS